MKKFLYSFLLVFLLSVLSVSISAASGICGESAKWEYDASTKTLYITGEGAISDIAYSGYNEKYGTGYIQPWIDYAKEIENINIGEGITSIGENAFYEHSKLKTVKLPETLESIYDYVFLYSTIETLTIPKNVSYISTYAFYSCNQMKAINVDKGNSTYTSIDGILYDKNVTKLICYPCGKSNGIYQLPETIVEIGNNAFNYNSYLSKIVLNDSLEYIGASAIYCMSSLKSMTIPASTWYIGSYNFTSCQKLSEIYVDDNNPSYCGIDGVLFDKEITKLIAFPVGKKVDSYVIPETVEIIKGSAFEESSVNNIELPQNLKVIEYNAFSYCNNLKTITVPESVNILMGGAIAGNDNLNSVYFMGDLPYADYPEYYYPEEAPRVYLDDIIYSYEVKTTVYYLPDKSGWDTLDKAYLKECGITLTTFDPLAAAEIETETETELETKAETEKETIWSTVVSFNEESNNSDAVNDKESETYEQKDFETMPTEQNQESNSQHFINELFAKVKPYLLYVIIVCVVGGGVIIIVALSKKKKKSVHKHMVINQKSNLDNRITKDETSNEKSNVIYCSDCGFKNESGSVFCGNCGKRL